MKMSKGGKSDVKRNLPSWMSAREDSSSSGKRKSSYGSDDQKVVNNSGFSNLMEGVVFALSGFVNPERGRLRSEGLQMGAEFQQDWDSNCTLLICAFPNTPKYRQVESEGGTIVSKEWISECHEQGKLVEIEPYLMHPGKPWKRQRNSRPSDKKPSTPKKSQSRVVKGEHTVPSTSPSKGAASDCVEEHFSSSNVKKWAEDDLKRTISWLENQDDKPESDEIKGIAAEGILTFLQDTIDALQQGQDIESLTEQWAHIPLVVEELAKFDDGGSFPTPGKRELCNHAIACKKIYELEFHNAESSSSAIWRNKPKKHSSGVDANRNEVLAKDEASYESDETIEMTEEEIDQAYHTVASTIVHT